MGGAASDGWNGVAIGNGCVYAGGYSSSTDGDFPAGLPGQMSAFVPGGSQPYQLFVMQLDVMAPIVQVADTDISVAARHAGHAGRHDQRGHHRVVRVWGSDRDRN